MSGILLGALAYSGMNKRATKHVDPLIANIYNSNLERSMNDLEKNQAAKCIIANRAEYLNQFDDLRFDNIAEPSAENTTYNTILGINTTLDRNLQMRDKYSYFDNSSMTYNVVKDDKFVHNNMTPFTKVRDISSNIGQRKLDTFTGTDEYWIHKQEKKHLFEPMADLTWVNGMPVTTDLLKSRYLASSKNNNGDLPFENKIRIKPGVDGDNQMGKYSVYRIDPPNVDQLRSDINMKVTYLNKPLETIKKGEKRPVDLNLTRFKKPDFREQYPENFVPNRSTKEGERKEGDYTNMDSLRGEKEYYNPGAPVNSIVGDGPVADKITFTDSRKDTFSIDNSRNVSNSANQVVMSNTKSYANCDNQRTSSNLEREGTMQSNQISYVLDYKDTPLATHRDTYSDSNPLLGAGNAESYQSYVNNDDIARLTTRQFTSHNTVTNLNADTYQSYVNNEDQMRITTRQTNSHSNITNPSIEAFQGYVLNNDTARMTIRQTNSHDTITNASAEAYQGYMNSLDPAKMTIRQTNSHNNISNPSAETYQSYVNNDDIARMTIRQTNSHDTITNMSAEAFQSYINNDDIARMTIRQTNSHNTITNASAEAYQGYMNSLDPAKMTIRQTNSHDTITNMSAEAFQSYINNDDIARMTIRQSNSHNTITNASAEAYQGYMNSLDPAKMTIRQSTSHNTITNPAPADIYQSYILNNDTAKLTIRQDTSHNISTNAHATDTYQVYMKNNDEAKPTNRQTIEDKNEIGAAHSVNVESSYLYNGEKARTTINETTIGPTPLGRMYNADAGSYYVDPKDIMRTTVKETTIDNNYIGNLHGIVDGQSSHEAANNMTSRDYKEVTTFNRPANGKKDLNSPYLNRDTVELNDSILYSYTPGPLKPLDSSIKPILTQNEIIRNAANVAMSKPIVQTSSYYINSNFINTLKDNPYVNDIYHQKNVQQYNL